MIRQLKNLGISIALDDFGTGYSSLSYLTMFPFDKIKIDQSFIRNMIKRAECRAIIASVLALGRGLGIAITAEGVETAGAIRIAFVVGRRFDPGLSARPRRAPCRKLNFDRRAFAGPRG